jgi:hypothetical protein
MRKVIVSELRSLDESCKPREGERRSGGTGWSTWLAVRYLDDAARAVAWGSSTLTPGEVR